jgi:hypothetical protein
MLLCKGYKIDNAARKRAVRTFVLVSLAAVAGVLLLKFFPYTRYHFYPVCPWYALTHTYCPGCGTLRGIDHMLHGDIFGLFKSNKIGMLFMPILLWEYIQIGVQGIAGYRLPELTLSKIELYILVVLIIAYWVTRNFVSFLAPC